MPLPKAVQDQVKRANQIIEELNKPPKKRAAKPESKPELSVVETSPETDADPSHSPESADQEPEQQTAVVPESSAEVRDQTEETADESQSPPAPQPHADEKWEQRYRVLKGKYDSEVPRLSRQISSMEGHIEALQHQISTLQTQSPEVKNTPVLGKAPKLVTDDELEDYGEDLVDLIGRRAQEVYEPRIQELQDELKSLKDQVGGVSEKVERTDHGRVEGKLDSEVKDWRQLNTDPEFLAWLDVRDVYSGQYRGSLLREAYANGDADRVVQIFKGFLNEHAVVSQPVATEQASQGSQQGKPKVDAAQLVAPGTPKAPSAGAQKEKRIWTQSEIKKHFHAVHTGKFKGSREKQDAIEKDIIAASREGRIRLN